MPYLSYANIQEVFVKPGAITAEQKLLLEEALYEMGKDPTILIEYFLHQNNKLEILAYSRSQINVLDMHRESGPAYYAWDEDGKLISKIYYQEGVFHRDPHDGFAIFQEDSYTEEIIEEYWWMGNKVDKNFITPQRRKGMQDGLGRVFL